MQNLRTYLINFRLRDSIRNILSISRYGNQHMQYNKPWVLVKGTSEEKYEQQLGSLKFLVGEIHKRLSYTYSLFYRRLSILSDGVNPHLRNLWGSAGKWCVKEVWFTQLAWGTVLRNEFDCLSVCNHLNFFILKAEKWIPLANLFCTISNTQNWTSCWKTKSIL